ncbi:hypothetical protein IP90_03151 [Luteimonas cucumeris]|uniref:Uncharacterized protein n=1 Tax=Luteimonas cucumeris TaxID=985012 RepID=A0A562KVJ5_9GAMM|nr:hypothetical protein [Luteimonas cucumeris]TWH99412.1 hypothetical protein IP90_03151 [Luteimonas cucumeris]
MAYDSVLLDVKNIVKSTEAVIDDIADKASVGGGWMSAIAKAMGKAMGLQAARVVALSDAIAKNASDMTGGTSDSDKAKDAKLAAVGQALNAQFQAASQELSMSSNAFATAIKALGEASTTLARKT